MALLQRTKKLFGPLLDDLYNAIALKEAMEFQVESYMQWRGQGQGQGHPEGEEGLPGR
jgi:hypothetical protein